MNYYISDLHFCHKNIIKYDERPFASVEEMNEILINNWNQIVKKDSDTTYILGDFVWGGYDKWRETILRLRGHKVLIKGNHDVNICSKYGESMCAEKLFERISDYEVARDGDFYVVMSHYPMLYYWRDYDPNVFMLGGHLHKMKEHYSLIENVKQIRRNCIDSSDNRGQIIPVECCQNYMNYTPQPLSYLIKCLDSGRIYGDK